jgi:hypothetical protein
MWVRVSGHGLAGDRVQEAGGEAAHLEIGSFGNLGRPGDTDEPGHRR